MAWWLSSWYLSGERLDGAIGQQILPHCIKCNPVVIFADARSHRKHMQLIHGSSVYFRDVDSAAKVKSAKVLKCYVRDDHDRTFSGELPCSCTLIEPPDRTLKKFIWMLHIMIGDHKPLVRCLLCGVVVFEELLAIHLQYNCNDGKAGEVFCKNPQSKNFGSLDFDQATNWDTLPPLDD